MADTIDIVDDIGERRVLMALEKMKVTKMFKTFGDEGSPPLIPRDQWKPMTLSLVTPAVKDQDGIGACNAFATVETVELAYRINGINVPLLSTGYLYGNINGQRDQGSMLEDAIEWMSEKGTCEESIVGMLEWRKSSWPKDAAQNALKYRVLEWWHCPTTEHVLSAIQRGFAVNIGVMWGSKDKTDANGWLPDSAGGSAGGHSIMRCSVEYLNGRWGIGGPNSWGTKWGKNGWFVMSETRLKKEEGSFGWFAVRSVTYPEQGDLPKVA